MSDLKVVGDKRLVSRITAIKEFFGMDAKTALAEVKELKNSDPKGYAWMGDACAEAMGIGIDQSTIG